MDIKNNLHLASPPPFSFFLSPLEWQVAGEGDRVHHSSHKLQNIFIFLFWLFVAVQEVIFHSICYLLLLLIIWCLYLHSRNKVDSWMDPMYTVIQIGWQVHLRHLGVSVVTAIHRNQVHFNCLGSNSKVHREKRKRSGAQVCARRTQKS